MNRKSTKAASAAAEAPAQTRENRRPKKEIDVFASTLQQTYTWLGEIMDEMGTRDSHRAYMALRAVLQTLRDRLPVNVAAHLAAQLPMLIRGMYYEGWKPDDKPYKLTKEEFLATVESYFRNETELNGEEIVRAVMNVLQSNIASGEIEQIKSTLPKEFGSFLEA